MIYIWKDRWWWISCYWKWFSSKTIFDTFIVSIVFIIQLNWHLLSHLFLQCTSDFYRLSRGYFLWSCLWVYLWRKGWKGWLRLVLVLRWKTKRLARNRGGDRTIEHWWVLHSCKLMQLQLCTSAFYFIKPFMWEICMLDCMTSLHQKEREKHQQCSTKIL